MKGVAIVSGGMDSVTLAHYLKETTEDLILVSFDYGQRHKQELEYAELCAENLEAEWILINLESLAQHLTGSALTDSDVDVPQGHYTDESMKATVVPNRNMVMLSIATAIAVANRADYVATGVHAGDHAIYPDCRPEFIASVNGTARIATKGFSVPGFEIMAPFVEMTKEEICELGYQLDVPFGKTWSCYEGREYHCGKCGTCVERKEAFDRSGVPDPTCYE
jgi:7-cyano-7-deazaguanine synthase